MTEVTFIVAPIFEDRNVYFVNQVESQTRLKIDKLYKEAWYKRWEETTTDTEPSFPYLERMGDIRYGLLLLAGILHEEGYGVSYLPLNLLYFKEKPEEAERLLRSETRDSMVIGATVYTPDVEMHNRFFQKIKSWNPNAITIVGGPHASIKDVETAKMDYIDVVVRGEGEETIKETMDVVQSNRYDSLEKVRGITYKTKDGRIRRNPDRPTIENLDAYPLPYFDAIPTQFKRQLLAHTIASRGCPYNCRFCAERAVWGPRVRWRSNERLFDEIEEIVEHFDQKVIHFADSTFIYLI